MFADHVDEIFVCLFNMRIFFIKGKGKEQVKAKAKVRVVAEPGHRVFQALQPRRRKSLASFTSAQEQHALQVETVEYSHSNLRIPQDLTLRRVEERMYVMHSSKESARREKIANTCVTRRHSLL